MADTTLYDTTIPTEGSVALAHQRIIRAKRNGVFENITGDVNNLALNPTPITVTREVYGTKGKTAVDIIGYSFAPTFTVEVVRDPLTKQVIITQPWLVELLKVAYSTGEDNRRDFQIFDAFDENLPAFEGAYSVAVTESATGYADKLIYAFTLTSFGDIAQITSPIATDGKPVLESAAPAGRAPGDLLAIRGYRFSDVTAITVDGANVVEFTVVDDSTLVVLVPATVSGSAPIVVTNAAGASTALPYTAA